MTLLLAACAGSGQLGLAEPADSAVESVPGIHPDGDPTDVVFDTERISSIELDMAPEDWLSVRDDPWSKAWVPAVFRWNGEEVADVAVRAFGYGSIRVGKPSLKVSFDRIVERQLWRELDELKLDNSSQDPGYLNECIATAIVRRAGLPAARTGWAEVSVNGDAAGFFVVLESIDDRFVERWFGHDDGALYGTRDHQYGHGLNPTDDPLVYYEAQTSKGGDGTDLAHFIELVSEGSDDDLAAAVDLEGFFGVSVARSMMGSMDAFSADGNNFYLYNDHDRLRLVPWDFDVDLGGYYLSTALTVDPRAPWATSPWSADSVTGAPYMDPVLLRSLAMGYDPDPLVEELLAGPFDWASVDAEAAAAAVLIRDAVGRDVLGDLSTFDQRAADLRLFVHSRLAGLAGGEVADCPETDLLQAADLVDSGTVGWGSLLVDSTNWGPGFNVNGVHTCTGVFAHAPSTVSLTIPESGQISGAVGLQDWNQRCGDGATFSIVQADEVLWQSSTLQTYDPSEAFDVEVSAGSLTLQAGAGGDYSCDTTVWLDLALQPG
ncbi:MAG TPA: CotH kinase family protein [Myxococcota bacterium]|nr:CotH kinase family protein [Myxococcota bacterium]